MSAPSAFSVSISTAVWMVMCSEPVMRAPFSGCASPNSSRQAIRPGISVSAISISLRPQSASAMFGDYVILVQSHGVFSNRSDVARPRRSGMRSGANSAA